jgi:trehalose 2-sulfotransferase
VVDSRISLKTERLAEIAASIPTNDFVNVQYDTDHGVPTSDALVILSTPRSGSTLLCELLRLNDVCLPHEYFQPAQYLPLFAHRWECVQAGALDELRYVTKLRRHRTFLNGWLGINLHGSHLAHFVRMAHGFSGVRLHYVHLLRRDVIAQAVSYHIASETAQWSSEFTSSKSSEYDFLKIQKRLLRVQAQNLLIAAYLAGRCAPATTLYYEDLAADPTGTLRRIPGVGADRILKTQPHLQRQSGNRSANWARLFADEYCERSIGVTTSRQKLSFFGQIHRLLRAR